MKIEKTTTGNIVIKNDNKEIEHIIATDVFLQKHPRNEKGILISKTPSNQDEKEAIMLFVDQVTSIDGVAFSGNRNDLMIKLSELFKKGGGNGEGLLDETKKLIANIYVEYDNVNRAFGTGWANGFTTKSRLIRKGFDVEFHYELPTRNNTTSWGGGYTEVQYSINDGAWRSLGNSGYQLAMGNSAALIRTDTKTLYLNRTRLNNPTADFNIKFKLRHRSYNGTLYINRNRGTSTELFASLFVIKESNFKN